MRKVLHRADSRGTAEHGWLNSRHSFSFADYHNPERMGFGLLRVLNDDVVQPGMGFGTHPHANMEIISIPLAGALRHQDSLGSSQAISAGEVQVMSAGSGVSHSEYNDSERDEVRFLQLWIYPAERDIAPRYAQQRFDPLQRQNRFQVLVGPAGQPEGLTIHQRAWISRAEIDPGRSLSYQLKQPGNGIYLFLLEGELEVAGERLRRRDGLGLSGTDSVPLAAASQADVLVIEVPLQDSEEN